MNPSQKPSLAHRLARFSLTRPVSVLVLFLSIVVVGVIATLGIPMELFPRGYVAQSLTVSVPWQNAPTREMMDKITLPLEEELSTVNGLDSMNSWTSVGNASVFLNFKQNVDMDVAYREARDRVERARLQFPEDADRFFIGKEDPGAMPIAMIGVRIPEGTLDAYNLIQDEIILPLSRIDGVAQVDAQGLFEREVYIDVDRKKAQAYGLNLYELSQELSSDNFTMASGMVWSAGEKYLLRSVAEYKELDELRNRPVKENLRIQDVANINYESPENEFSIRVDGEPAFALGIKKEGSANTVELCRRLAKEVERLNNQPELRSVDMEMFFDQGAMIRSSIMNLVGSGRVGGALAALVLYVFLRRLRMTLIITLSIPLSLLIALLTMYFSGETLNVLTMLSLVICVGLLIDNSVVVAENIHRLRSEGLARGQACLRGASEIALAITMATLTTIVVFLPVSLVEGQMQFFLQRMSIPICVALLASLFVALVFIPLVLYLTLDRETAPASVRHGVVRRFRVGSNRILGAFYDATFGRLNRVYVRALRWAMSRRSDFAFVLMAVFVATQFTAAKKVRIVPSQEEDQMQLNIGVRVSNEYTFEEVSEYFEALESIALEMKEELGLYGFVVFYGKSGGNFQGWFDRESPRKMTAKEASQRLADAFPDKAGIKLMYGQVNKADVARGGSDTFNLTLFGDDPDLLKEETDRLEPQFESLPGVLGSKMRDQQQPNELSLVMNRERMSATGVNPEVVAGMLGYALQGRQLTRFNYEGKEIPIRVRFQKSDRRDVADILTLPAPTEMGSEVPIASLTDLKREKSPEGVFRQERRVARTITLELEEETAEETRAMLMALMEQINLPEGISFESPSNTLPMDEIKNMQLAAMLSIAFVYLLMAFLFESFILPLSIIMTVPLAALGVIWGHIVFGKDMDILGLIGGILLIGVVVNNGIVLIDYVNRLRAEGMDRATALLTATSRRFRPITMTAMTTIFGMIPLTVSPPNEMGISYKSFGVTLIGGMTVATILTLLVTPIFYTFFDDARVALNRTLNRAIFGRRMNSTTFSNQPAPTERSG